MEVKRLILRTKYQSFYGEFLQKLIFVICGILYWVYGMTIHIDKLFSLVILMSLITTSIHFVCIRKKDFRKSLAIMVFLFGAVTLFCNEYKKVTMALLFYMEIKLLVLSYCSKRKGEEDLRRELDVIYRTIFILGSIIIVGSLIVYRLGMTFEYTLSDSEYAVSLFLGRDPIRGSLCGIFANANRLSTLCAIYVGSCLHLYEKTRHLVYYVFALMAVVTQYYTGSRSGIIATSIVIGLYYWFKFLRGSSRKKCLLLFLTVFIGLIIIVRKFDGFPSLFVFLPRSSESLNGNTQLRIVLWRAAIKGLLKDKTTLLFGVGQHISGVMECNSNVELPKYLYPNVHNAFLQDALQFGIPSAIGILAFFIIVLRRGWSSLKRHYDGVLCILFGIITAQLITNLVENDLLGREYQGSIIWIFAGYLYALSSIRENNKCRIIANERNMPIQ